ncbi:amino acid permease [Enterococcus florum]|uniref:amino acid permease n=1 Tax=Enterococcus florum TaxID=2480627 RepID=UPI001D13192C|nr:amino acid permease [Enterococcus florum]
MLTKNTSVANLILIITTTVFSFSSMLTAFFMLGSQSLVWFLISALGYFIPYALIVAQYTKKYAHRPGSIYDWLKDSLSPKAAFVTVFLWYCSYFIWMISLFMKVMIPLSILLCGKDTTAQFHWFELPAQFWLSFFAIVLTVVMTTIITRGIHTIFSFLKLGGYTMVGLVLLTLISNVLLIIQDTDLSVANLRSSIAVTSFFSGTGNSLLSQLPFFIFSITAFGGLDTIASLADKTKKGKKRFPKAVIISSCLILLLYFSGILLWSSAHDIEQLRQAKQLHLGNLMYGLMAFLGESLGRSFGLSASTTELLIQIFVRYTAFTMLVAYLSLLSSISYGPLKSLIQGTPQIFRSRWAHLNDHQMPAKALWIQAAALSLFIGGLALNNHFLADLFNQLTYMTNVSRAIPYFIVAASFPFFIKKKIIQKESLLIPDYTLNYFFSFSVCLCISVAILFQMYEPLKIGNYQNFFTLLIGPLSFGLLASLIYKRIEEKSSLPDV